MLMGSVRPPSALASSILGTVLMLLGHAHSREEASWKACRHMLKHHRQMVDHMHTLGLMVAKRDAPVANFQHTTGVIKRWTQQDHASEEEFLQTIAKSGSSVRVLRAMAEWCLALHAAWRDANHPGT